MELELEAVKRIREWVVEGSKSIRIFVFGKTGVGKSSLINTLLGTERAQEGAGIYTQTKGVESYTEGGKNLYGVDSGSVSVVHFTINDVEITIWDSPGLRDPFVDEKQTIEEIKKNCKNIDLFIYCTPLTQTRISQDDFDSISALSKSLGNDVWNKALIALTFANQVDLPQTLRRGSTEQQFDKLVSDWSEALRYAIVKAGVNKEVAEGVPVVPASYRDIPIPGARKEHWYSTLWIECLKRIRFMTQPAFLSVQKEKTPLMVEAIFTIKEYLMTTEFMEEVVGSESTLKLILDIKASLLTDQTLFINTLAEIIGINPSALNLTGIKMV